MTRNTEGRYIMMKGSSARVHSHPTCIYPKQQSLKAQKQKLTELKGEGQIHSYR